jgi:hypothetical protein
MSSPLGRLLMLEFVTWFVWLGLFALLQRRLCRTFPGIRSLCRYAFLATMAVALVPGIWILAHAPHRAPHLLCLLNHYFGIGVYAQTSLRALVQLQWLALAPLRFGFAASHTASPFANERNLLAVMAALSQMLRGGRTAEPRRDTRRF